MQITPLFLLMLGVAALMNIALPIVVAVLVQRRLRVGVRYMLYGALIFALFQLFTRVPAVFALQTLVGPALQESRLLQIAWLAGLALTAGLFEEVGRSIGFRWLMRNEAKTWAKAVVYGLGHGGIESIVLVGGAGLLTLVNLVALTTVDPAALGLNEQQRVLVAEQLRAINAQPIWLPLVAVWERIWSIAFHVGMSVVVVQGFVRGKAWRWVVIAIGLHALTNFIGVGAPLFVGWQGVPAILLSEGLIMLAGLGSLGLVRAFRTESA